jgi:PAS domain S-box-containing protein
MADYFSKQRFSDRLEVIIIMQDQTHALWNNRFICQIIDSMADGVFTLDKNGQITSWNPAMERISGYPAEEALGKTCRILQFNRCFGRECPVGIKNCGIFKHGASEAKECFLQHKHGHDVPVIKNAGVVRDEDGGVIGVVETVTDMSELNTARAKAEEATLRLGEMHRLNNIIGKSQEMLQVFRAIKAAAASDATILIQGESGTGKELVAGAIHYNGDRTDKPLVTVNCSALSESLLESELFGHVKGAFTGAIRDRMGRFEEARGGTIFLDEIGELSPFIQVKLLRVLQAREIERVGESRRRKIDIRIITATHRDLYGLVKEGQFREDLYYRLKVFPIFMPLLRQRKEDIPLLLGHFIKIQKKKTGKPINGVSHQALRMLMDYNWPGNVRELENAIEHAFVLRDRETIEPVDLPVEIRQADCHLSDTNGPSGGYSSPKPSQKLTKAHLIKLLVQCDWNKAEVGRRIGVSRTAVWKYMKKWDIPLKKTP